MTRFIFSSLFFALLFMQNIRAQILNPVDWSFRGEVISEEEVLLVFEATLDPGWNIYSQYLESDDGPIRTSITFETEVEKIGEAIEEGKRKEGHDAMFDMNVIKFADHYTIKQKIKTTGIHGPITGYVEFMTCDETRCLPPTEAEFSIVPVAGQKTADDQERDPKKKDQSSEINEKPIEAVSEEAATDFGTIEFTTSATDQSPEDYAEEIGENTKPVDWTAGVSDDKLIVTAAIKDGWKIYAQDQPESEFSIQPVTILIDGDPVLFNEQSDKLKTYDDPIFKERLAIITSKAEYSLALVDLPVDRGQLEIQYMACDHEQCIFPEPVLLNFDRTKNTVVVESSSEDRVNLGEDPILAELYAIPKPIQDDLDDSCIIKSEVKSVNKKGFLQIFWLGFLGGLLALLTPCVFPMIPLTVSFFAKQHEQKKGNKGINKAFLYAFSIVLIYFLLSVPFHLLDTLNPDILNNIATNVYLNIFFFVIFIFFAFSFFGFYEITIPSSWTNKVSQAEGKGGLIGVFFMALTLSLVSFSCTGPILGSLLAGALSSDGGASQLTTGMVGFGLALALPFGLFASAPKLMDKLPKSGSWMTSFKVILGFIELALAFKFLSVADMVKQWGLLKYEIFMIIWIICALGIALYLFNLIKFPHDSPNRKLSPVKVAGALFSVAIAGYLAYGLTVNKEFNTYQSLSLMSGLAPPTGYSYAFPAHCPNGLSCFNELSEGMAYAQANNKPVLLDFTGFGCVNCRKMEEHVWPEKEVYDKIKNDYVLISLYVDDKTPLDEIIEVKRANGEGMRKLKRKGDVWQHFQTTYFRNNSQPFYVLLSPDGEVLNTPVGYTPDVGTYAEFLSCGLDANRDLKYATK